MYQCALRTIWSVYLCHNMFQMSIKYFYNHWVKWVIDFRVWWPIKLSDIFFELSDIVFDWWHTKYDFKRSLWWRFINMVSFILVGWWYLQSDWLFSNAPISNSNNDCNILCCNGSQYYYTVHVLRYKTPQSKLWWRNSRTFIRKWHNWKLFV